MSDIAQVIDFPDEDSEWQTPLRRLTTDEKKAVDQLGPSGARYLVSTYYRLQEQRIRTAAQFREQFKEELPNSVAQYFFDGWALLENQARLALGKYAQLSPVGEWSMSVHGIGPVISAGLLAHIDITRAPTVGHIWRFAGLDPTVKWNKGERRPWNAELKVICWHAGECFKRTSGSEKSVYGKVYKERKALEVERNEAGQFADQAAKSLEERNIRDKELRATYEAGKLPAGRLDLRATRYATKLFLAHWHHVAYEVHYGKPPPKPYIIEHGGHTHYIAPPNWPL